MILGVECIHKFLKGVIYDLQGLVIFIGSLKMSLCVSKQTLEGQGLTPLPIFFVFGVQGELAAANCQIMLSAPQRQ